MKDKIAVALVITACCFSKCFGSPSQQATRVISADQLNAKLAKCISLIKDEKEHIVSYYVNGITPSDAEILIQKSPSSLSSEFTIFSGVSQDGSCTYFMMPSAVVNDYVKEIISLDLLNHGAVDIKITSQTTGQKS